LFDGVVGVTTSSKDPTHHEVTAKLRRLQHQDGRIRKYVKEFQELLLEIPNMGEQDALFCFFDGLRGCAKMELERRGVQDLASAITAAESLIEFKRESSKGRGKKNHEGSDSEGDRDNSPKRDRPLRDKGNRKKYEAPKKYSYFFCSGPHRVFECPKRGKLAALVMEDERQEAEGKIASISLLSAIQTKVGEQTDGRMYIETEVEGKKLEAMVDTEPDTIYMAKELANEIRLPYKKEKGYVKGVIAKSLPIHGVVRDADIQIGPRKGKVHINVSPLDDRKFYLGMDFLDKTKDFIIPYAKTLFITADGQVHSIPMRREAEKERVLPALRFSKNQEPGYLTALKTDERPMYVKP